MRLIDADLIEYHEIYDGQGFMQVAYADDISELPTVCNIDAIRAEIQKPMRKTRIFDTETQKAQMLALAWCLEIIDRYTKGESHESHKADD